MLNNKKYVHQFFSYICNGKFAVFWVLCCGITCKQVLFSTIDLYFYQLAQIVEKYIIDSFLIHDNLQQKLNFNVFQLAKRGTLFGLLHFSLSFVFLYAATNRINLAFRTIIIEDTHLTLAVISFNVEANDFLFFCPYKHTRKNLPSFRSCSVYNSLVLIYLWLQIGVFGELYTLQLAQLKSCHTAHRAARKLIFS